MNERSIFFVILVALFSAMCGAIGGMLAVGTPADAEEAKEAEQLIRKIRVHDIEVVDSDGKATVRINSGEITVHNREDRSMTSLNAGGVAVVGNGSGNAVSAVGMTVMGNTGELFMGLDKGSPQFWLNPKTGKASLKLGFIDRTLVIGGTGESGRSIGLGASSEEVGLYLGEEERGTTAFLTHDKQGSQMFLSGRDVKRASLSLSVGKGSEYYGPMFRMKDGSGKASVSMAPHGIVMFREDGRPLWTAP